MTETLNETARPTPPVFVPGFLAIAAGAVVGAIVGAISAHPSGFALWLAAIGAAIGSLTGAVSFLTGVLAFQLTRRLAPISSARPLIVVGGSALSATVTVLVVFLATRSIDFGGILAITFVLSAVLALAGYGLLKNRCV